jgi:hypothetical protein
MGETREESLLRTSEVYRRLRTPVAINRDPPALELSRVAAPPDMARALPQRVEEDLSAPEPLPMPPPEPTPGPGFVRRMFTRRPDLREIVLLLVVALALWLAQN